jgi:hypothetical protein
MKRLRVGFARLRGADRASKHFLNPSLLLRELSKGPFRRFQLGENGDPGKARKRGGEASSSSSFSSLGVNSLVKEFQP